MPSLLLQAAIVGDNSNQDTSALTIFNLQPSRFPRGVTSVPPYLYQSVQTLLGLQEADNYPDFVSASYGDALTIGNKGVDIACVSQESELDGYKDYGIDDDTAGAEHALCRILVRIDKNPGDLEQFTVKMVHKRLRLIIDDIWRYNSRFNKQDLLTQYQAVDPTIDPLQIWSARWVKYAAIENSIERVSLYSCNFVRMLALVQ